MQSQVVTSQVGQQRGAEQEWADTLRIREFLRMNSPSFSIQCISEDTKNINEELRKVFEVMHVGDTERVKLGCVIPVWVGFLYMF